MNIVLLWKEYRQQRALWLGMFLLAAMFMFGVTATFSEDSVRHLFGDDRISVLLEMMTCTIAGYGIVSGALLIAAEKEDNTLVFLDTLACRRSPVWFRKVLAGVLLTVSQTLVLIMFAMILGFNSWEGALFLLGLGLNALGLGLLASAFCRSVLGVLLIGLLLMIGSYILAFPVVIVVVRCFSPLWLYDDTYVIIAILCLILIPFYASWRIFCRTDLSRRHRE